MPYHSPSRYLLHSSPAHQSHSRRYACPPCPECGRNKRETSDEAKQNSRHDRGGRRREQSGRTCPGAAAQPEQPLLLQDEAATDEGAGGQGQPQPRAEPGPHGSSTPGGTGTERGWNRGGAGPERGRNPGGAGLERGRSGRGGAPGSASAGRAGPHRGCGGLWGALAALAAVLGALCRSPPRGPGDRVLVAQPQEAG